MLPAYVRNLLLSGLLLFVSFSSRASHLVGGQLTYQWISCNTYKITVTLYGNCGEASASAFSTLPVATPEVCIFNGTTLVTTLKCTLDTPGYEVTPVCPDSLSVDQCTIPTSDIPGIKKFQYSGIYTFPTKSAVWRLIYTGDNTPGTGTASGRAAAITNLLPATAGDIQLIDTLNNSVTNTRGHNSSPVLTVEPIPFFCVNTESCYNPGAVDLYDTSHLEGEPSGDSLNFTLAPATEGFGSCGTIGGACGYSPVPYCGGTTPLSGAFPLVVFDCTPASFSFDPVSGQLCFNPSSTQRAVVVYNIDEYRNDTVSNIHTIAGTGPGTYGGDGVPAVSTQVNEPAGIRADAKGNIYFADYLNNRVRKINSSGIISTVAGNGLFGYCGDGGPATTATLGEPIGVGIDTSGNVIFADYNNNVVRKINVSSGIISTIAGNGVAGYAGDGGGALGAINTYAGSGTPGFGGDGSLATAAIVDIQNPAGICQDGAGNTYFSDYTNNRIRIVTPGGSISTIAGSSSLPGYCGDGALAVNATLNNPLGLAADPSGNLVFADYNNNVVRKINMGTGVISTIAGNGVAGFSGDGGGAGGSINTFAGNGVPGIINGAPSVAEMQNPAGICQDAAGNTYFSDFTNNRIRMVSAATGLVSTFAGTGTPGYSGDNGAAPGAALNGPNGMWIASNSLYFADLNNNVIRKIDLATTFITTVAGSGAAGFAGDGGPATAITCKLNHPNSVFVDGSGNIFITDGANERIREVSGTTGNISTIAGNGVAGLSPAEVNNPYGLFVDASGNVYFADAGNNMVRVLNPTGTGGYTINPVGGSGAPLFGGDGGPALAATFNSPTDVIEDASGNIFVSDRGNSCIRKINTACGNIVSTVAGTGGVSGYAGDGLAPTAAKLANPSFIYLSGTSQQMYISDYNNNRIRFVTPCELNHPTGVFVDNLNNTYISDAGNERIRKIDPFGTITTIAGNGTAGYVGGTGGISTATLASLTTVELNNPYGLYVDAAANIYFADAGNNVIRVIDASGRIYTYAGTGTAAYSGDGGAALAAGFNNPTDVFEDLAGDLFVADQGNSCIRKIGAPTCGSVTVTTIAGRGGVAGYSGDGLSPDSAKLSDPSFIYLNATSQDLYISDFNNNRVRIVTPCELNHPTGIFVDKLNNTYISDAGNQRVRKITGSTGVITSFAGNGIAGFGGDGGLSTATACQLNNPYGLYADGTGNVYIADENNNRIRMVNTAGIINTAVGSATAGFAGDDCDTSSATSVQLNHPSDVAMDAAGNIFIADKLNNRIRMVDLLGDISTVAGNGTAVYGGDGGPGYLAGLDNPDFLCLDTSKNVLISDMLDNRIRKLDHSSVVNRVVVGTMQREMTFTVLTCTNTTPTGTFDSVKNATRVPGIDSSIEVYACQNTGNIFLYVNPGEADTNYNITIAASGLNIGFALTVVGDNTHHPKGIVSVNTAVVAPGRYTFYLTYTDNHCPLEGTFTQPFTVDIYPVPSISVSSVFPGNCKDSAALLFTPGGYGLPWTIKISQDYFPYDTLKVISNDTTAFLDSLAPSPDNPLTGLPIPYIATIYTSVSNVCAQGDTFTILHPPLTITGATAAVSYCGEKDGKIFIAGLPPGGLDTVIYKYGTGVAQHQGFISSFAGTDTVFNLHQGIYDSIIVQEGFCFTNALTLNISFPPFTFRTVTGKSPTKCGYCNGVDTVFGLHPGQFDTLEYRLTQLSAGVLVTTNVTTSALVDADSFVVFSGLCNGTYDNFQVNTFGIANCYYEWPGAAIILQGPLDTANFTDTIHYGCNQDTIMFYNHSVAAPGDVLYYHWDFGDGTTDIIGNPYHVYNNTINDTANIILTISNTKCVDTFTAQAVMNNYIHAAFSLNPNQYICQLSADTFTNLSTGINPSYTWYYGDGDSDVIANPVHIFTNSGQYTITLVAEDHLIPTPPYFAPCNDTARQTLAIDSTSSISIDATDSVICSGQAITFTGEYTSIGNTGNVWTFSDGNSLTNVNPIQHSYDGAQVFTVTVTALYRVCAAQTTSRTIRVYDYPNIYLGPDTSICSGSAPIVLSDDVNAKVQGAKWLWSTGDSTSSITITQPGDYSAVVTIDGCSSYDTVVVLKNCYMDIPNAFTPNGDGTNDYFYPRQLLTKGLTSFNMDIYNRWGQLIYQTTSIDGRGWDGTFNGTPQPEGVYVYVIEAAFKDGQYEHHQGNVTLIR